MTVVIALHILYPLMFAFFLLWEASVWLIPSCSKLLLFKGFSTILV